MAENIVKLRVDSKEYESKLERARQGLQHLENELQKIGQNYTHASKEQVQYVQALGQMGTVSQTVRGKIGEMTKTFTELAVKYKQLSDEEKKSPFGQALSASLDQLRTRTVNAKRELEELNNELSTTQKGGGGGGGLFSGGKLSGMLQVAGGNLITKGIGMATSALTNLTSEITECVQQGIQLARQGEGIRNAFERLGRGDLLAGLREATHGTVTDLELMKAAVKFDDFKLNLDELGTMLAFAQQKAKDTGQSVDYMVDSIVTGLGRKSLMILDNLGLSANEVKEKMKETGDMTKAVGAIIREQMQKSGDYVETAADRAAQASASLQNKMEEIGRLFGPIEEASTQLWTSMKVAILEVVSGPLARLLNGLTEAGRLRNMLNEMNGTGADGQTHTGRALGALRHYSGDKQGLYNRQIARYNELENKEWQKYNQLQARQTQLRQQYGSMAGGGLDKAMEAARNRALAWQQIRSDYQAGARAILNPSAGGAVSAGGTGDGKKNKGGKTTKQEVEAVSGSIDYQAKKVQELQKAWRAAADDDSRQKIKKQIEEAQFELDKLEGKTSGIPQMNYGLGDLAGKEGSGVYQGGFQSEKFDSKNPWKLDDKAMKALGDEIARINEKREASLTKEVGDIAGGISGILGGIESLGIDLPQGMKDVVSGIQGVISILTGISSIITAIQTISTANLFKLAGGGIVHAANGFVGGNRYSTDDIPVAVSSGELILNRAQQGNLVSQLSDSQRANGPQLARVSGEQIYIAMSNYLRRSGKGELVTWR